MLSKAVTESFLVPVPVFSCLNLKNDRVWELILKIALSKSPKILGTR